MEIYEEAENLNINLEELYHDVEFDFAFIEFAVLNNEWKIVYDKDLILMRLVEDYEYEIEEAYGILDYDFQMFILI